MSKEREEVYQILELGKHLKNLHHKKGFGGLLFIDLSMIKFSKLSSYIRQLDKESQELKKRLETYEIDGYKQDEELNKMSFDIRKYKIQQKEFINYLEDESKKIYRDGGLRQNIYKEVLKKYKEIIGGKDV